MIRHSSWWRKLAVLAVFVTLGGWLAWAIWGAGDTTPGNSSLLEPSGVVSGETGTVPPTPSTDSAASIPTFLSGVELQVSPTGNQTPSTVSASTTTVHPPDHSESEGSFTDPPDPGLIELGIDPSLPIRLYEGKRDRRLEQHRGWVDAFRYAYQEIYRAIYNGDIEEAGSWFVNHEYREIALERLLKNPDPVNPDETPIHAQIYRLFVDTNFCAIAYTNVWYDDVTNARLRVSSLHPETYRFSIYATYPMFTPEQERLGMDRIKDLIWNDCDDVNGDFSYLP